MIFTDEQQRKMVTKDMIKLDLNKVLPKAENGKAKLIKKCTNSELISAFHNEDVRNVLDTMYRNCNENVYELLRNLFIQTQQTYGNSELNFALNMAWCFADLMFKCGTSYLGELQADTINEFDKTLAAEQEFGRKELDLAKKNYFRGKQTIIDKLMKLTNLDYPPEHLDMILDFKKQIGMDVK